jgi:hypothetical protein
LVEKQRSRQEAAIDALKLVDTGIEWVVPRNPNSSEEAINMVARAGKDFDVLVVAHRHAYSAPWDAPTAARAEIHQAGAVVLYAITRRLSSEDLWPTRWFEDLIAEEWSRRHSRRMTEVFAAKRRRQAESEARDGAA